VKTKLPEPLRSYFEAVNREDVKAMLAPFARTPCGANEGKTRRGVLELREWIEEGPRNTIPVRGRGAWSRTAPR